MTLSSLTPCIQIILKIMVITFKFIYFLENLRASKNTVYLGSIMCLSTDRLKPLSDIYYDYFIIACLKTCHIFYFIVW